MDMYVLRFVVLLNDRGTARFRIVGCWIMPITSGRAQASGGERPDGEFPVVPEFENRFYRGALQSGLLAGL